MSPQVDPARQQRSSDPYLPAIEESLGAMNKDGSRKAIHPADVRGRFITRRRALFAVLMGIYVALPLVRIGGHPAVHLDVAQRRFYLFGSTFNAQDFWIALFILTTVAFTLLFLTAWLGRVWCGWACPQTVFLEGLYRPIERLIDGSRERRLREQSEPWTVLRVGRAALKHGLYVLVSAALAHVALAFFLSAGDLLAMIREGPFAHPVPFAWAVVVTTLLYLNYAWFREQLCIVLCPYGRLQSVMQDRDSLTIGYDVGRGEPRGRPLKGGLSAEGKPLGDCVDCKRCVVVCPTAIDIRNGLQMECIGCAQCIDACDEVMDRLKRPRGLIRYDSLHGLAGEPKRVARPRLYAYGAVLVAFAGALVVSLWTRAPFEANLLRGRGLPYTLDGQVVQNQFELHLVNKLPQQATFKVSLAGAEPMEGLQTIIPQPEVTLASLESYSVPLFVRAPRERARGGFDLRLTVTAVEQGLLRESTARFLAPASAP